MYVFLRVKGMTDSLAFCKRLVREHGLGLAPGAAFGHGYAQAQDRLEELLKQYRRAAGTMSEAFGLIAHSLRSTSVPTTTAPTKSWKAAAGANQIAMLDVSAR